jgi:hypothetical protein
LIAEALQLGPKLLVFLCRVRFVLDRLAKPALGDVVAMLREDDETAHSVPVGPTSRIQLFVVAAVSHQVAHGLLMAGEEILIRLDEVVSRASRSLQSATGVAAAEGSDGA